MEQKRAVILRPKIQTLRWKFNFFCPLSCFKTFSYRPTYWNFHFSYRGYFLKGRTQKMQNCSRHFFITTPKNQYFSRITPISIWNVSQIPYAICKFTNSFVELLFSSTQTLHLQNVEIQILAILNISILGAFRTCLGPNTFIVHTIIYTYTISKTKVRVGNHFDTIGNLRSLI